MATGKAVTREWSNVPLNDMAAPARSDGARSFEESNDVKVSHLLPYTGVC